MSMPNAGRQRGSSLLECAAALAVGGIVLAGSASASHAAATMLRRARMQEDTLAVARMLLEHQLGAPCAAAPDCPQDYRCQVDRTPITTTADRVVANVERRDGLAREQLATLAPAPGCGS